MVEPAGVLWLALLPNAASLAAAATLPDAAALSDSAGRTATPAEYRQSLEAAAILAQECFHSPQGCDGGHVGADLLVRPGDYTVHYDWLRSALRDARAGAPAAREQSMREVMVRLYAELASLDAPTRSGRQEQDAARAILAQPEFRSVDAGPSWWQRQTARFWAWLDRVLFLAANAGARRPWIGLAVEWTLLGAALAGLLAFLLRAVRADRGVRELPWRPEGQDLRHSATDWEALAASAAAAQRWRDAVHALYWASVASLASQGRWREQAPRTPREYLRLLGADSNQRSELAELTALLERVWYAHRSAGEPEYRAARGLAEKLGVPDVLQMRAGHA